MGSNFIEIEFISQNSLIFGFKCVLFEFEKI